MPETPGSDTPPGGVGAEPLTSVRGPSLAVAAALAMVVFFDLQTNLPLLDEWARRWTIQRFAAGRGLTIVGQSPALVQGTLILPLVALHLPADTWRLTAIPFIAAQCLFTFLIAERLGAIRFWAAVAAATAACTPIFLYLATGIMTEVAFIGLMMAALYFSVRWMLDGVGATPCIALVCLAILQRPQGLLLAVGITAGILAGWRMRPRHRREVLMLAGLWVLALGCAWLVTESTLGRGAVTPTAIPKGSENPFIGAVLTISGFPAILGLCLIPLAPGIWSRPATERGPRSRFDLLPVGLATAALAAGLAWTFLIAQPIFSGPILTHLWLGIPVSMTGQKAPIYPLFFFFPLEALATFVYLLLLVRRRRSWRVRSLGAVRGMLVLQALLQVVPILIYTQLLDRYYLESIAILCPVVASFISGPSAVRPAARRLAVLGLFGGILMYGVGEQDYLAWQVARDAAARAAYSEVPASQVEAGLEEDAEHVWLPAVDRPSEGLPIAVDPDPQLRLELALANDPRPGFAYWSLAPGKIVIVRK